MEKKLNEEQCKKAEVRDVVITVRVTKSQSLFMKQHGYSPSRILIEAVKMLGWQNK